MQWAVESTRPAQGLQFSANVKGKPVKSPPKTYRSQVNMGNMAALAIEAIEAVVTQIQAYAVSSQGSSQMLWLEVTIN